MLFTEELRKCLNAAGLSDCGENDAWNYWYQRVLKAHNEAVERQIATEQAENAKLRELVRYMHRCYVRGHDWGPYGAPEKEWVEEQMRGLGIEVDG